MDDGEQQEEQTVQEGQPDLVSSANAAAENLRTATREMREIVERAEKLKAVEILSGRSEAGISTEKPKEETPSEYAAKVMRGELNE